MSVFSLNVPFVKFLVINLDLFTIVTTIVNFVFPQAQCLNGW